MGGNRFIDVTKIEYNKYLEILEEDEVKEAEWFSEELQLQFSNILVDLDTNVKMQTIETAIRLKPYFETASMDKDQNISSLGKEGLAFIKNEFPDIFKKY